VISPSQRPQPENTQHSQQTDIHVSGGIRTGNPSKRAAADPRLRPRGHCDLPFIYYLLDESAIKSNRTASKAWVLLNNEIGTTRGTNLRVHSFISHILF
jgi:hypothetical protein